MSGHGLRASRAGALGRSALVHLTLGGYCLLVLGPIFEADPEFQQRFVVENQIENADAAPTAAQLEAYKTTAAAMPLLMQQFLNFLPLPHGQGSFRPTLGSSRRTVFTAASSPPTRGGCLDPTRSLD